MDYNERIAWRVFLRHRFGKNAEREARLDALDAETGRQGQTKPSAAELAQAREAGKWADYIRARSNRRHFRDARNAEAVCPPLDEIPVWTPDQAARLRYIVVHNGQFPPEGWEP
jgi:hypothetical protein